jgi:hypothetical protein
MRNLDLAKLCKGAPRRWNEMARHGARCSFARYKRFRTDEMEQCTLCSIDSDGVSIQTGEAKRMSLAFLQCHKGPGIVTFQGF